VAEPPVASAIALPSDRLQTRCSRSRVIDASSPTAG